VVADDLPESITSARMPRPVPFDPALPGKPARIPGGPVLAGGGML